MFDWQIKKTPGSYFSDSIKKKQFKLSAQNWRFGTFVVSLFIERPRQKSLI